MAGNEIVREAIRGFADVTATYSNPQDGTVTMVTGLNHSFEIRLPDGHGCRLPDTKETRDDFFKRLGVETTTELLTAKRVLSMIAGNDGDIDITADASVIRKTYDAARIRAKQDPAGYSFW